MIQLSWRRNTRVRWIVIMSTAFNAICAQRRGRSAFFPPAPIVVSVIIFAEPGRLNSDVFVITRDLFQLSLRTGLYSGSGIFSIIGLLTEWQNGEVLQKINYTHAKCALSYPLQYMSMNGRNYTYTGRPMVLSGFWSAGTVPWSFVAYC